MIDDGCPENSGLEAKKFINKNKNIKVIFHKKNLGYGAAVKTGLRNSKINGYFKLMVMQNTMFLICLDW